MKNSLKIIVLLCFLLELVLALNRKSPLVYVVTPSSGAISDEGRSAPFYYHSWMRRMDSSQNVSATTTTTTPKVKTPDLIFAEFESESGADMRKSIRKLLEQEKVLKSTSTTSTTMQPIFVSESKNNLENNDNVHTKPEVEEEQPAKSEKDMTDYFALYSNLYNNAALAPVYLPSTTTTTTTPAPTKVENIWHIIDSEKLDQHSGKWEEVPVDTNEEQSNNDQSNTQDSNEMNHDGKENVAISEDFALPGFGTNPGNGGENESRAIRTEPNLQFPYVSLKPFQMKNLKKPLLNVLSNNKKSNMFTNLDNFKELKNPVRGEAQDYVPIANQPIDRYNPAQPYLPHEYGSKSKQSSPSSTPVKTVANLVPPPPPPSPKVTANDFPPPSNYESFPPYAPSGPASAPGPLPPSQSLPSDDSGPNSSESDDEMDIGYRYKPPVPPAVPFVPTLPPVSKPVGGYVYDKPANSVDSPPVMDMSEYSYNKPSVTMQRPPGMDMGGYTYDKPPPTEDHASHSYGHHSPPSYHHDSDYPELIFGKPHGDMGDIKGGDTKGHDVPMMPPPPPPSDLQPGLDSGPPSDDHGFPPDFLGDLKFHHDFDDHDFYHHHHHTTTTTTEMPRVNRFSYYYLGKKLYYLPLYFSVYFIVYVGALIIKAVLRHKIVYPNSWRPNDQTASFFSKRSVDSWDLSNENLHEVAGRVTKTIAEAAEKYMKNK